MISKKMQKAINDQINAELHSAYLYMSMVSYFKSSNLDGFAQWMTVQTQEEVFHATKFFNFVLDRGGRDEGDRRRDVGAVRAGRAARPRSGPG